MSLLNSRRLTAMQRYGDEWNSSQRGEEPLRRADRNFADLLQEVRVVLTGVQLLFGFLLTLAVSDRFRSIDPAMKALYVGVLVTAALTIGLFVAPVCYHRRVFQCGRKQELVRVSHRLVTAGLITMWLTVLGAVVLVLSLILHTTMALLVTGLLGVFLAGLWWLLPSCGGGPGERLAAGKGQISRGVGPPGGAGR
ncbi:MAG TPA: DUF6328 family protein [Pseudonocardiaceae bacterium]|nr:DUF6328 family protein [Pseudonocardiaceae bacterium]